MLNASHVIFELIESPLTLPLPLIGLPTVKLPLEFTGTPLDDVNSCTTCEP